MLIDKIYIQEGFFSRELNFTKRQLIYSKSNSQGKTTLMRLILHSLGFSVPPTSGIKLNDFVTKIYLTVFDKKISLERFIDRIIYKSDEKEMKFILPEDTLKLHSLIFDIDEIYLLENILGSFYVDQTKGSVVLNRGEVIGNNTFTIEKFIAGLQNNDIDRLTKLISDERKSLKEYKSVLSIVQYKIDNNIDTITENELIKEDVNEYNSKITILKNRITRLKTSIKQYRSTKSENQSFLNIIEGYKLYVEDENGKKIEVNSNNIIGYNDNVELLNTQIKLLDIEKRKLEKELNEMLVINNEQEKMEIDIKEYKEIIDEKLKYINLDYSQIKSIIDDKKANIRKYNSQIRDSINNKKEVVDYIQNIVFEVSKMLKVYEYIKDDGVFTRKIQKNSGAIFYKLIISFRIAYLLAIEKYKNIRLPFLVDSLRNVELDETNANLILNAIKQKLPNHQIIIASIYEYEHNDFFDGIEVIKDRLIPVN